MDADEILRALGVLRERRDGYGRGVGSEHRRRLERRLRFLGRTLLDLGVLEHGLDDEVRTLYVGVVGGRRDQAEELVLLLRPGAAFLDRVRDQIVRMRLALFGRRHVTVEQHHRNAGLRRHVGDARAHEARAENGDLPELRGGNIGRTARALVQFLQRDEERADHRRRLGRPDDLGEVALFDPEAGVERNQQSLIGAFQDGRCCGIVAGRLAAQNGDGRRPEIGACRRVNGTAGQLEPLFVPRRDRLQPVADHLLRRLDQLVGRGDLMDEVHLLRLGGRQRLAAGQHFKAGLGVRQAHDALRAARAGEQSHLHLRQAHGDLFAVGGDAPVAGQRHFEGAAHAGAVDRRDKRLAAGFKLAEKAGHAPDAVEQHLHRRLGVLGDLFQILLLKRLEHGEIGAAGKTLLARGDHRALDGGVGDDGIDDGVEFVHHLDGEDVHGTVRHVPGDQRNAVGVGFSAEVLVGHSSSPPLKRAR